MRSYSLGKKEKAEEEAASEKSRRTAPTEGAASSSSTSHSNFRNNQNQAHRPWRSSRHQPEETLPIAEGPPSRSFLFSCIGQREVMALAIVLLCMSWIVFCPVWFEE